MDTHCDDDDFFSEKILINVENEFSKPKVKLERIVEKIEPSLVKKELSFLKKEPQSHDVNLSTTQVPKTKKHVPQFKKIDIKPEFNSNNSHFSKDNIINSSLESAPIKKMEQDKPPTPSKRKTLGDLFLKSDKKGPGQVTNTSLPSTEGSAMDIETNPEVAPLKYTEFYYKDYEQYEYIEDYHEIPTRPTEENKFKIDFTQPLRIFVYSADIPKEKPDIKMSVNDNSGVFPNIYLSFNLENGETGIMKYLTYMPYFYVRIPDSMDERAEDIKTMAIIAMKKYSKASFNSTTPFSMGSYNYALQSIPQHDKDIDTDKVVISIIRDQKPSVEFRNGKPATYLQIHTTKIEQYDYVLRCLSKYFPVPSQTDIEMAEQRKTILEFPYICEGDFVNHKIKMFLQSEFIPAGWIEIQPGDYGEYLPEMAGGEELFVPHRLICWGKVKYLPDIQYIPGHVVEYVDIEQANGAERTSFPNAYEANDWVTCLTSCLAPTDKKWPPVFTYFTWGGKVKLPEKFQDGVRFPRESVRVRIYKNEAEMFDGYVEYRRRFVPNFWSSFGGIAYDFWSILARISILNVKEQTYDFQRVSGFRPDVWPEEKKISIQAGVLRYRLWKNMICEVPLDLLFFFMKDVTLKVKNHKLATIASHKLGETKEDFPYELIKAYHMGDEVQRGLSAAYNIRDVLLLPKLDTFMQSVFAITKIAVNTPEVTCTGGQQKRLLGGFLWTLKQDKYILDRPPYHPVLDKPLGEGKNENTQSAFSSFTKKKKKKTYDCDIGDEFSDLKNVSFDMGSGGNPLPPSVTNQEATPPSFNPAAAIKEFDIKESHLKSSRYGFMKTIYKPDMYFGNQKIDVGSSFGIKKTAKSSSKKSKDDENSYSGGHVIEPLKGYWTEVVTLDFKSLYPSIMFTWRLDGATIVFDLKYVTECGPENFLKITFNKNRVVYLYQKSYGPMLIHLDKLLDGRASARGVQESYDKRLKWISALLKDVLEIPSKNIDGTEFVPLDIWKNWSSLNAKVNTLNWRKIFGELIINNWNDWTFPNYIASTNKIETAQIPNKLSYQDKPTSDQEFHKSIAQVKDLYELLEHHQQTILSGFSSKMNKQRMVFLNSIQCFKELMDIYKEASEDPKITPYDIFETLKGYLDQRENEWNAKQNEYKIASNSVYGIQGAGGTKWHDDKGKVVHGGFYTIPPIPAAVTFIGRHAIQAVMSMLSTEFNACIIYGDTDSGFVKFPPKYIPPGWEGIKTSFPFVKKDVLPRIKQIFGFIPESRMEMAHEKTGNLLISDHKKQYVMRKVADLKVGWEYMYRGFKFIKNDTSPFVNAVMTEVVNALFIYGHQCLKMYLHHRLITLLINNNCSEKNSVWLFFSAICIYYYIPKMTKFYESISKERLEFTSEATAFEYADTKLQEMNIFKKYFRESAVKHFTSSTEPFSFSFEAVPYSVFEDQFRTGCTQITDETKIFAQTSKILKSLKSIKTFSDLKLENITLEWEKFSSSFFTPVENPFAKEYIQQLEKSAEQWFETVFTFCKQNFLYEDFTIYKKIKEEPDPTAKVIPDHIVVRNRMESRAKGRGPKQGESVAYVHILNEYSRNVMLGKKTDEKVCDMIDDVGYVKEKKIKVNYQKYIQDSLLNSIAAVFTPIFYQDPQSIEILDKVREATEKFKALQTVGNVKMGCVRLKKQVETNPLKIIPLITK